MVEIEFVNSTTFSISQKVYHKCIDSDDVYHRKRTYETKYKNKQKMMFLMSSLECYCLNDVKNRNFAFVSPIYTFKLKFNDNVFFKKKKNKYLTILYRFVLPSKRKKKLHIS